jgi:hypothetical protein
MTALDSAYLKKKVKILQCPEWFLNFAGSEISSALVKRKCSYTILHAEIEVFSLIVTLSPARGLIINMSSLAELVRRS